MIHEIDDFDTDVIQQSYDIPVLVDFWAEWCGPCKVLGPVLEKLATDQEDLWVLAKVNIEKYPLIASRYMIQNIPNVKLFVDGETIDGFVGVMSELQVTEWLSELLPSRHQGNIDYSKQLLLDNKTSEAKEILDTILEKEPDNDEVIVLLAQVFLRMNSDSTVQILDSISHGSKYFDLAESIRNLYRMFKYVESQDLLPDNPVKSSYIEAISNARSWKFEIALDLLIDILSKNREYDNDGSRRACIAIFLLLGEEHQITKHFRPIFSSALF